MNNWILGFDKTIVTPADYKEVSYYSAGYAGGCRCTDVLDDMYVRSIWLDDNSGKGGIAFAVIDCVGMSNKDVLDIRGSLKEFSKTVNNRGINILFTHCHSAVDTQGLWGKLPKTGRVPHYMAELKEKIAKSIVSAFTNKKPGKLFVGDIATQGLLEDTREPVVFDDKLTRITFKPDDGNLPVTIVHFAVHPEVLGGNNPLISADFPSYMGKYIEENIGSEFVFINGAIGGLITCPGLDEIFNKTVDNVLTCKEYGLKVGKYAVEVGNDIELKSSIDFIDKKIDVPVSNIKFVLARKFNLVTNEVLKIKKKPYKYVVPSELGYLSLGNYLRIMLVPGELYSEIAMGGYLDRFNSSTGKEMQGKTLFEMMPDGKKLIFGLCNDELGYIIPENDFFVHPKLPYVKNGVDKFGREHYEETNSIGFYAARTILDASAIILKKFTSNIEQR